MDCEVHGKELRNDAYWLDKLWKRLASGDEPENKKLKNAAVNSPLLNFKDGILIGAVSNDLKTRWRDEPTIASIRAHGYDPEADMLTQLRFRNPEIYKGFVQAIHTVLATNEPVVTLIHEAEPKPRLLYCKLTPYEGGLWWLCIDLARFGHAMSSHNFSVIEEFSESIGWSKKKQG